MPKSSNDRVRSRPVGTRVSLSFLLARYISINRSPPTSGLPRNLSAQQDTAGAYGLRTNENFKVCGLVANRKKPLIVILCRPRVPDFNQRVGLREREESAATRSKVVRIRVEAAFGTMM